jgi:hypothetical protein
MTLLSACDVIEAVQGGARLIKGCSSVIPFDNSVHLHFHESDGVIFSEREFFAPCEDFNMSMFSGDGVVVWYHHN